MGYPKDLSGLEQSARGLSKDLFEGEPPEMWEVLLPREPSLRARRMAWQEVSVPYFMLLFLINAHRRFDPEKYLAWHGEILSPFVGKPFSGSPDFGPAINAFIKLVYYMSEATKRQQDSFISALQWFCEDLAVEKERETVELATRVFIRMSQSVDEQLA